MLHQHTSSWQAGGVPSPDGVPTPGVVREKRIQCKVLHTLPHSGAAVARSDFGLDQPQQNSKQDFSGFVKMVTPRKIIWFVKIKKNEENRKKNASEKNTQKFARMKRARRREKKDCQTKTSAGWDDGHKGSPGLTSLWAGGELGDPRCTTPGREEAVARGPARGARAPPSRRAAGGGWRGWRRSLCRPLWRAEGRRVGVWISPKAPDSRWENGVDQPPLLGALGGGGRLADKLDPKLVPKDLSAFLKMCGRITSKYFFGLV